MTAAAAPITTIIEEVGAGLHSYPMADNKVIYAGTMVCLNSAGLATPAADAANLSPVVGIAMDTVDNTIVGHAAGGWPKNPANWIVVRAGVVATMTCASATQAMVGLAQVVYVLDDNNVIFSGGSHSVLAGYVDQYMSATQIGLFIPHPCQRTVVALTS